MGKKIAVLIFVCFISVSLCSCSNSRGKIIAQGITPGITDYHNRGDLFADVPKGAAFVDISTGGLNVRSDPTTNANNYIAYLYPKEIVEIIAPNDPVGWHKVRIANGVEGYCKADFLTSIAGRSLADISSIYNQTADLDTVQVYLSGSLHYITCSINATEYETANGYYKPTLLLLDKNKTVLSLIPTHLFGEYVWLESAAEADLNGDNVSDLILLWGCNSYQGYVRYGLDICIAQPDNGYRNLGGLYDYNGDVSLVEFIYDFNPLSDEYISSTVEYIKSSIKLTSAMYNNIKNDG